MYRIWPSGWIIIWVMVLVNLRTKKCRLKVSTVCSHNYTNPHNNYLRIQPTLNNQLSAFLPIYPNYPLDHNQNDYMHQMPPYIARAPVGALWHKNKTAFQRASFKSKCHSLSTALHIYEHTLNTADSKAAPELQSLIRIFARPSRRNIIYSYT